MSGAPQGGGDAAMLEIEAMGPAQTMVAMASKGGDGPEDPLEEIHPIASIRRNPALVEVLRILQDTPGLTSDDATTPRLDAAVAAAAEAAREVRRKQAGGDADKLRFSKVFERGMILEVGTAQARFIRSKRRILEIDATFMQALDLDVVASRTPLTLKLEHGSIYVAFKAIDMGCIGRSGRIDGAYVSSTPERITITITTRPGDREYAWYGCNGRSVTSAIERGRMTTPLADLMAIEKAAARQAADATSRRKGSPEADAVSQALEEVAEAAEGVAQAILLAMAVVSAAAGQADPSFSQSLTRTRKWPRRADPQLVAAADRPDNAGEKARRKLTALGLMGVVELAHEGPGRFAPIEAKAPVNLSGRSVWPRVERTLDEPKAELTIRNRSGGRVQSIDAAGVKRQALTTSLRERFADQPIFVLDEDVERLASSEEASISSNDMLACGPPPLPYGSFVVETPPWSNEFRTLTRFERLGETRGVTRLRATLLTVSDIVGYEFVIAVERTEFVVHMEHDESEDATPYKVGLRDASYLKEDLGHDEQIRMIKDSFAEIGIALNAIMLMSDTAGIIKETHRQDERALEHRRARGLPPPAAQTLVRLAQTTFPGESGNAVKAMEEGKERPASREIHLRRGHKRRVAVGEGRTERRWHWFPATIVGRLPDGTKPSEQALIARRAARSYRMKA